MARTGLVAGDADAPGQGIDVQQRRAAFPVGRSVVGQHQLLRLAPQALVWRTDGDFDGMRPPLGKLVRQVALELGRGRMASGKGVKQRGQRHQYRAAGTGLLR